jgi:S1-C subfamily serine protease
MCGAAWSAEGEAFDVLRVVRVLDASPAGEAGLLAGDVLLEVDGRPAASLGLGRLQQMFREEEREHTLRIARDGKTLEVRLRLRRLL